MACKCVAGQPGASDSPGTTGDRCVRIGALTPSTCPTFDVHGSHAVLTHPRCCAGNTYLVFAAVGAVALVTIYLTVPETKGKTLEEIESMFASGGKGE